MNSILSNLCICVDCIFVYVHNAWGAILLVIVLQECREGDVGGGGGGVGGGGGGGGGVEVM
jgi:uncharacterized membrane protein